MEHFEIVATNIVTKRSFKKPTILLCKAKLRYVVNQYAVPQTTIEQLICSAGNLSCFDKFCSGRHPRLKRLE